MTVSLPDSYFYPRPPRGGRHVGVYYYTYATSISIHALREEGDVRASSISLSSSQFLSTPSARRATHEGLQYLRLHGISIHALREEGDEIRRRTAL